MDLPADGSELPLDRAVHVLVLGQVAGRVERDLGQPLLDLGELVIREQAGAVEPRACWRLASQSYGRSSASSAWRKAQTEGSSEPPTRPDQSVTA